MTTQMDDEQIKRALETLRRNGFETHRKKITGSVYFKKYWKGDNETGAYVYDYDWVGGDIIGISTQFMAELCDAPRLGQIIDIGPYKAELTELSASCDMWYARYISGKK